MPSIENKTALVTGASSGIGAATVERLLAAGAKVYAAARRVEKMKDLEQMGAVLLKMDVTDEKSMISGVESILAETGSIDILINNAGYGSYGAVEDVPIAEAKRQFEVNIFGLARLTQLVLPGMRKNGYGKIVNISSMGGKIYTPFGGWYHSTKFALEALTDCLRLEVKPFGIDPVIIEPGGIATEWGQIAADNLKKTSGSGPYAERANKTAAGMEERYAGTQFSSPDVIAKVILKAVTKKNPRPRYAAGYAAKFSIWLRKQLPDRLFDKVVNSLF